MRLAAEAQAEQARQQALQAQTQVAQAQAAQAQAVAQAEASADRVQLEQVRQAPPTPPIDFSTIKPPPPVQLDDRPQRELRASLAQRLNACFPSHDTPRGLVATVSSFDFRGAALDPQALGNISQIASLLEAHPGLIVNVEGYSDTAEPEAERLAALRAGAVRDALVRAGAPAEGVNVRALGNTRPIGPSNTAQSREANRRVEIVISGGPIGSVATWDRTYPLIPRN